MKKNGFTLTEMIAVIVIIGLIILVAIPVSQNLMANNKEDKYKLYVETVEKAIYTYGDIYMKTPTHDTNSTISLDGKIEESVIVTTLNLEKFDGATVSYKDTYEVEKDSNGKISIKVDGSEAELNLEFVKGSDITTCTKYSCS